MLKALALLVVVVSMARDSHGYPSGPPVEYNPGICTSMMPNHGTTAQASAAPYTIIASGTCYKEQTTLKVRVKIMDIDAEDSYFEGFFVLARAGNDTTASHGTFADMGDTYMEPLTCFDMDNDGIGHSAARHFLARTFEWTAPNADMGYITFTGTIVKEFDTFWQRVTLTIPYNSACTATNMLADEAFDDIGPVDQFSGSIIHGRNHSTSEQMRDNITAIEPCVSASHAVGSREACSGSSISAQMTVVFGFVAVAYKLFA